MCHVSCIDFGKRNLKAEYFRDKTVIEVGAFDVNGSLRPIIESFRPRNYVGVDLQMGPGVDQLCNVEDLIDKFGCNSFDAVICTEVLEHVSDWKKAIHNLKQIIKPEGILLITTRSAGFGYHGYPFDFWRYEISDIKRISYDLDIKILENDPKSPGVFLLARKPKKFIEKKITNLCLYSIIIEKRASIIASKINWKIIMFLWNICKLRNNNKYYFIRIMHYYNHPFDITKMLKKKMRILLARI